MAAINATIGEHWPARDFPSAVSLEALALTIGDLDGALAKVGIMLSAVIDAARQADDEHVEALASGALALLGMAAPAIDTLEAYRVGVCADRG